MKRSMPFFRDCKEGIRGIQNIRRDDLDASLVIYCGAMKSDSGYQKTTKN